MTPQQREADVRYHQPYWKQRLPGHISSWLLRRELFERVGGFQPGMPYAEDIDWRARAADCGAREHRIDAVLSYRRIHANNVTARDRRQQMEGLADMMKAHLDRVRATA
jgi:GT2 family glycosyltransferase